ncbi:hypothetical protein [Ruixingdingia sedimenti]|uniref:Uncharacterized protein n=1 Tax=Ruixingdingia sedimenti TaxID=3073604 RepID=A0ABU1FBZ3_9RHOB|nr:hypothetical protein [Xinfangfangia sp. LG-4]MDR5654420.1 hypothetical protein [Xinfangfangia sp. LG-4]
MTKEVSIIGVHLAKQVFQLHRATAETGAGIANTQTTPVSACGMRSGNCPD